MINLVLWVIPIVALVIFVVLLAAAVLSHDSRMRKAHLHWHQRRCPGHCVNFGPCDQCGPHDCPASEPVESPEIIDPLARGYAGLGGPYGADALDPHSEARGWHGGPKELRTLCYPNCGHDDYRAEPSADWDQIYGTDNHGGH
jgi:hypothetical protein